MTTEPITLQMALDDPAPLDFDTPRSVPSTASITCRVHHLPAPANPRGILLCPDCLDNLDSAAQHIAHLRETTIDGWVQWLAEQSDQVLDWWRKMESLRETNPKAWAGKATLAAARGGRGAAVVQAWRAKEATLKRCAAAEREIEGAR